MVSIDADSENYAHAAKGAWQFFVTLSIETDPLNAKIIAYADRLGRITKQSNPAEDLETLALMVSFFG